MDIMPDDLRKAYETFLLLCVREGYSFAGMAMCLEPPSMFVLGNVNERGHDLATLFRLYADLIDQKTDAGQVENVGMLKTDKAKVN